MTRLPIVLGTAEGDEVTVTYADAGSERVRVTRALVTDGRLGALVEPTDGSPPYVVLTGKEQSGEKDARIPAYRTPTVVEQLREGTLPAQPVSDPTRRIVAVTPD